jgi:predicted  nucleic acid-binding Zn-ribbon protein
MDERVLELWDQLPPAEKAAESINSQIEQKKKELAERRKGALEERAQIESEFKRLTASRGSAAEAVKSPSLIAKYDSIRQRHSGIGMTDVTKTGHCGACGTHLPERTLQMLKDDRTVTCESCHRLLYYTEGIV